MDRAYCHQNVLIFSDLVSTLMVAKHNANPFTYVPEEETKCVLNKTVVGLHFNLVIG